MELANCKHTEKTSLSNTNGQTYAVCETCGQERSYIEGDEYSIVITKLGRIDGAIVMPPAGTRFDITPEESRLVKEGWDIINKTAPATTKLKGWKSWANRRAREAGEPVAETIETAPAAVIAQPVIEEETIVAKESTDSALKPDNWPDMKPWQRGEWYDGHKQEILADLATIGSLETRKKWGVPYPTLNGLLKRWKEPPLVRTGRGKPALKESGEPVISKKVQELLPIPMPLFPTFDKEWRPEVQIEWLKTYAEIVKTVYPGNK